MNLNCNSFILAHKDDNHVDNRIAFALATEVIVLKIHKACRLRKTDVSISFIDAI